MPVALFGITNDALSLVVNLLLLFIIVLWLALIAWTYFDARRRIADPVLVACATAAALFPFVGTIVYSILRPPEFLADQRERDLEIRASELRVRQLEEASCPNCEHPIERTFLRCPSCRARIKDPCESCGKPIDPRWSVCPYCEAPVRGVTAPPERRAASPRRPPEPARQPARGLAPQSARPSGSASRASGAGSRRATATPEPTSRPASSTRPATPETAARPASPDGRPATRPAPGEPARTSSASRSSREPSRSASQRGSSTREPKRGE